MDHPADHPVLRLLLRNSRKLSKFPVIAPVPVGFTVQPVDPDEVAARLVEVALGGPLGRAPDMAGPLTWPGHKYRVG